MPTTTDDLRIRAISPLIAPQRLHNDLPAPSQIAALVQRSRNIVHSILTGDDDRLLVVVGPCSIHDPKAALDYAKRLAALRAVLADQLEIVMRVYFEKPRTTIGWKGLINDPHLDGSFDINGGLRLARRLLLDINTLGLPAACEFLDMTTPQYIADLVAWAAIGARTTESQIHRQLASGVSSPVGFKNGTLGEVQIAIDAVVAASRPHHFLAVTKSGRAAIAATAGNKDCHVILRGGISPNYDATSIDAACRAIEKAGQRPMVMVDASHANSRKKPENQPLVVTDIAKQIASGEHRIIGIMVESHLVAGRQDLGGELRYGQSVTDGCIGWEDTIDVLQVLADAIEARRAVGGVGVRARRAFDRDILA